MSATQPERSELELRDYLRVLRRRKWWVIASVGVCLVLGALLTLQQTRIYEAQAQLVVETPISATIVGTEVSPAASEAEVQTEAELMGSRPVARRIEEILGYRPQVKISTLKESPAVFITAEDADPQRAALQVNDYTNTYVDVRQDQITEVLELAISDVRSEVENLDVTVTADKARIDEIQLLLSGDGLTQPERALLETERDRLQAQVAPTRILTRQAGLQSQLDQLSTRLALAQRGDNFTVSGSAPPTSPIRPQPIKNGIIALSVGLLIGIILAFLRDYFDDTLRTKEDLDLATGGVPVVGLIPAIAGWRDRDKTVLEAQVHPHSAASEAYRTLRTSLAFASIERRMLIIQITSSTSGEGKTTTAANLAVTLANTGKQVVLVDCDLRRPRVHDFFSLTNDVGFASVLLGEVNVADALQPVDGVPGLHVLPSGPPPPNPAELLSTVAAKRLLEGMGEVADYVVVDSPPLLPVADSTTLAGYADATILLVTAKATTRRSLNRSLEILDQINAPLEGILFNGVGREATYGYGYGYSYTDDAPTGRKRRQRKLPAEDQVEPPDEPVEPPDELAESRDEAAEPTSGDAEYTGDQA